MSNFSLKDFEELYKILPQNPKLQPYQLQIIESLYCADKIQFRFPCSKKRRIREKWKKRAENYKIVPWENFVQMEKKLYSHPSLVNKLRNELEQI